MNKKPNSGIFLNYVLIAITNLSGFILTPMLINGMGLQIYGVYLLVFSTSAFFMASDFGIGTSVIGSIVRLRGEKDKANLENYLFLMLMVYMTFAVIVFLVCRLISFYSPMIFEKSLPSHHLSLFKNMFALLSVNCVVSFLQNYLFSIIAGLDKIVFSRTVSIIKLLVRTAGIALIVFSGANPYAVILLDLVLSILSVIVYFIYSLKLGARIRFHHLDIPLMAANARSMLHMYVMPISDNLYWYFCTAAVAMYIGAEAVGQASIAVTLCHVLIQLTATLSYFKLPRLSELWEKKDEKQFYSYVFTSARTQVIFIGGVIIGFLLAGQMFLRLWVGEAFTISYHMALVCMISLFIPLSQSMLEMTLYVQHNYRTRTVIMSAGTIGNALLLHIFVQLFGLMGVAYAVVTSMTLFSFVAVNIYYRKSGLPAARFNFRNIVRILPSAVIAALVGLACKSMFPDTIPFTILNCFIAELIYLLLVFRTYVSKEQRIELKARIGKILRIGTRSKP